MFERINKKVKGFFSSQRMKTLALMLLVGTTAAMAQNAAGDYSAGTTALTTVTEEIAKYVPIVVKLCYAIAGVVAIVGAISVYIAMNNEEQRQCLGCCNEENTCADDHRLPRFLRLSDLRYR